MRTKKHLVDEQQTKNFRFRIRELQQFEQSQRVLVASEWWGELQLTVFTFFNSDLVLALDSPELLTTRCSQQNVACAIDQSSFPLACVRNEDLFDLEALHRRRADHEVSKNVLRQTIDERNAAVDCIYDTASCAVKSALIPTRPTTERSQVKKARAVSKISSSCLTGLVVPWELVLAERIARQGECFAEQTDWLITTFLHFVSVDCLLPYHALISHVSTLHHWPTTYRMKSLTLIQRWWRWTLDASARRRSLVQLRNDVLSLQRSQPASKRWRSRLQGLLRNSSCSRIDDVSRVMEAARRCSDNLLAQFVNSLGRRVDSFIRENYTSVAKGIKTGTIEAEQTRRRQLQHVAEVELQRIHKHETKLRRALCDELDHEQSTRFDGAMELWPPFPVITTSPREWSFIRTCEELSEEQRVREIVFDAPRRRREYDGVLARFAIHGWRLALFGTRLAEQNERVKLDQDWFRSFCFLVAYHRLKERGGAEWNSFVQQALVAQGDEDHCRRGIDLEAEHYLINLQQEMNSVSARLTLLNDRSANLITDLEQACRSEIESLEAIWAKEEIPRASLHLELMLRATRSLQQAGLIENNFTSGRKPWARAMQVIKRRASHVLSADNFSRRTNYSEVNKVVTALQRWWRTRKLVTFADVSKRVLRGIRQEKVRQAAVAYYFKVLHLTAATVSSQQLARCRARSSTRVEELVAREIERRNLGQVREDFCRQFNLNSYFVQHIRCFQALRTHLVCTHEPAKRHAIVNEWSTGLVGYKHGWEEIQRDTFVARERKKRRDIMLEQAREWICVDAAGDEMTLLRETIAAHSPQPLPTIAEVVGRIDNVYGIRRGFLPQHNQRETLSATLTSTDPTFPCFASLQEKVACRESVARTRIQHDSFSTVRAVFSNKLIWEFKHTARNLEQSFFEELQNLAQCLDLQFPHPPIAQVYLLMLVEERSRKDMVELEITQKRAELFLDSHAGVARLLWLQFLKSVAYFRFESDYFYKRWGDLLERRVTLFATKLVELEVLEQAHRSSVEFFEDLAVINLVTETD